jgi:hypothetical protein
VRIAAIGDPAWLVVELGVEQITITADGQEPINVDIDEARDLGNNLIVASWLAGADDRGTQQGRGRQPVVAVGDRGVARR